MSDYRTYVHNRPVRTRMAWRLLIIYMHVVLLHKHNLLFKIGEYYEKAKCRKVEHASKHSDFDWMFRRIFIKR